MSLYTPRYNISIHIADIFASKKTRDFVSITINARHPLYILCNSPGRNPKTSRESPPRERGCISAKLCDRRGVQKSCTLPLYLPKGEFTLSPTSRSLFFFFSSSLALQTDRVSSLFLPLLTTVGLHQRLSLSPRRRR